MRTQIWTTAFALLAGGALAAPSIDAAPREPRLERTASWDGRTPSEDGALVESVQPLGSVLAEEGIEIARKSRSKKGGGRGGARSKSRGGFSKGSERSSGRGGGGARASRSSGRDGDRSVERNIDADDLDDAYTSDEEKAAAAVVGGVIGLGVGRRISESEDPGESDDTGY